MEPELACIGALHSPETGIIDGHALHAGAARRSRGCRRRHRLQHAGDGRRAQRRAMAGRTSAAAMAANSPSTRWSIAPGLARRPWRAPCADYPAARVPRLVLAKGNYFTFAGKPAFSRLIYPTPIVGGLGVHVTLDLAGRMRFGPDVEWVERENYDVDPTRAALFYERIRTYWPGLPDGCAVAGLFRHPAQAHRAGRAAGGFPDRHAGAARPAGTGADVRDRVAGADHVAVAGARKWSAISKAERCGCRRRARGRSSSPASRRRDWAA